MSQDLASLVIGLRADVATLQSDLGKANALNQRYAREASDTWTKSAGEIGAAIGAAAVAFAGVAAALGKQAIDTADQFNKMSQKVGVSVETLSALSVQAKLSDVDLGGLESAMGKLAKSAAAAATGGKEQAQAFKDIGVSVKDASGNLKPMDQLLSEVATKFATFKDSGEKSAEAVKIFGKAGQDLIPMLNEIGTKGLEQVIKNAKEFGAVVSTETAQAAEHFNDNLTLLNIEVHGFANAVAAELLPNLNQLTDDMVQAGKTTDSYKESAGGVADVLKGIVFGLIAVKEFLTAAATLTFAFYDAVKTTFTAAAQVVGVFAASAYKQIKGALSLDPDAVQAARDELATNLAGIAAGVTKSFAGIKFALAEGVGGSIDNVRKAFGDLFGDVKKGAVAASTDLGKLPPKLHDTGQALADAAKAAEDYAASQLKAATFLSKLAGAISPVDKAYETYTQTIIEANKVAQDLITTSAKAGKAQEGYAAATKVATAANVSANKVLDQTLARLREQGDVLGRLQHDYADQAALVGLTDRELAMAEASQKAADEWQKLHDAGVPMAQTLEDVKTGATNAAGGLFDLTEAAKNSRQAAQEWQGIWSNAANSIADSFANAVVNGGDLMKSLVDIAKQVVQQIISYFLKLQIINPILNSIFGGQAGWAQLATGAMGGGGGGSSLSSLASLASSGGGGGGAGGYGAIFGAGSSQTFTGSMFGTGEFDSGFGAAVAPYLGAAAGVYAGYNRYQQAGGGLGGVAGGAAYGVGTYYAAVGTSAALGGGLAAGAAAIPVVGWIALAAMLIDKFSGGKLFGTKGDVQSGVSTLSIGQGGADYSTFLALKGQSALFGGAKWSTENIAQTPEEAAAAKKFYDSMVATMAQYAEQFGAKAGDLVSAKFGQQFDKHGNPTGITSATIAGHEYSNLKPEEFQQAFISANELAILSQFDAGLNATIEQYRDSVADLNAIAAGLSQAQAMFHAGGEFLAIAGDQTLSAVVHLAEGMQQAGETIGDTISRLIQAQGAYDQFVAQFKPAATFASGFQEALSAINAQMVANANQANALARAAGAEHASTQDLINIHNLAAQQFAAAVALLQANANSLAASLGYALPQNLDDINAQIAAMESQANSSSSAIGGFGDAMQAAAQKAQESMNLLLGDLSPLNDQQKLQTALEGLRAGTASAEQVLQIGRQLYATGSDYNALFSRVMAMVRGAGASLGGGGGGSGSGINQSRLAELKAQRDAIMEAQAHAQAEQLAQMIADLMSANDETLQQALDEVGIKDIGPFLEDLGLTNQTQLQDLVNTLAANTDSAGESTSELRTDIQAGTGVLQSILTVLQQIAQATPGAPGTPSSMDADALPNAMRDLARALQDRGSRGNRPTNDLARTR